MKRVPSARARALRMYNMRATCDLRSAYRGDHEGCIAELLPLSFGWLVEGLVDEQNVDCTISVGSLEPKVVLPVLGLGCWHQKEVLEPKRSDLLDAFSHEELGPFSFVIVPVYDS